MAPDAVQKHGCCLGRCSCEPRPHFKARNLHRIIWPRSDHQVRPHALLRQLLDRITFPLIDPWTVLLVRHIPTTAVWSLTAKADEPRSRSLASRRKDRTAVRTLIDVSKLLEASVSKSSSTSLPGCSFIPDRITLPKSSTAEALTPAFEGSKRYCWRTTLRKVGLAALPDKEENERVHSNCQAVEERAVERQGYNALLQLLRCWRHHRLTRFPLAFLLGFSLAFGPIPKCSQKDESVLGDLVLLAGEAGENKLPGAELFRVSPLIGTVRAGSHLLISTRLMPVDRASPQSRRGISPDRDQPREDAPSNVCDNRLLPI
eukprot:3363589-Rhodomonas_salina.9